MTIHEYYAQFGEEHDVFISNSLKDYDSHTIKDIHRNIIGVYCSNDAGDAGYILHNDDGRVSSMDNNSERYKEFKYKYWMSAIVCDPIDLQQYFKIPCYLSKEIYVTPVSKNSDPLNSFDFTGKYIKYTEDITEDIYKSIIKKLQSLGWDWTSTPRSFLDFKSDGYLIYQGVKAWNNINFKFNVYSVFNIFADDISLDPFEFLNIPHPTMKKESIPKEEFTLLGKYIKYTPEITEEIYNLIIKKLQSYGWNWNSEERDYIYFKSFGFISYTASMQEKNLFEIYEDDCISPDYISINIFEFLDIKDTPIKNIPDVKENFTLYRKYFKYDPSITADIFQKLINKLSSYGWRTYVSEDERYETFRTSGYLVYTFEDPKQKVYSIYTKNVLQHMDIQLDIKTFLGETEAQTNFQENMSQQFNPMLEPTLRLHDPCKTELGIDYTLRSITASNYLNNKNTSIKKNIYTPIKKINININY